MAKYRVYYLAVFKKTFRICDNSPFIEGTIMKRELGIARCGLACCLCSENDHCGGCARIQKLRWKSENICFQKDIASERMIKDIPVSRILSYQNIMWLYLFMAAFGIGMKDVKMRQHQKRERNFGLRSLIKMSKTTR